MHVAARTSGVGSDKMAQTIRAKRIARKALRVRWKWIDVEERLLEMGAESIAETPALQGSWSPASSGIDVVY